MQSRAKILTEPSDWGTTVRPVAIDLFCGAGGLSLGFEQAGFDVLAAVEYDPVHAATHAFNFPKTEMLCRDVATVTAEEIKLAAARGFAMHHAGQEWDGLIDVLVGGPPCQGFSVGGKRDEGDKRNDLVSEFARLVEELRPKAFCLENVAGLLEDRFASVLDAALERFRAAGYQLSGTDGLVNSLEYGVPQSRKRVLIFGMLGEQVPERPQPTNERNTVRSAFDGLPNIEDYIELLLDDVAYLSPGDVAGRLGTSSPYARKLAGIDSDPSDLSYPRMWNPLLLTNNRRTMHSTDTINRFADTEQGSSEPKSRLYRLPLEGHSRTLRAGSGSERGAHTSPRPIHPTRPRAITVREAARIHGYPDWFRLHTTNWHGHRQIGNSVPPPLARAAATAILRSLCINPEHAIGSVELGDPELLRLGRLKAKERMGAITEQLPASRQRKIEMLDTSAVLVI